MYYFFLYSAIFSLLLLVFWTIIYQTLIRRKILNNERWLKVFKQINFYTNVIFIVYGLWAFALLLWLPANLHNSSKKSVSEWHGDSSIVIEFDKPVNKDSIKISFYPELNGTMEYDNSFLGLSNRFVFTPEETVMPGEDIYIFIEAKNITRISSKYFYKLSSSSILPTVKVSDYETGEELHDRQNINPEAKILLNIDNFDENLYEISLISKPNIDLKLKKLSDSNYLIEHPEFDKESNYEISINFTPKRYSLKSKQVLEYREKFESQQIKFKTAKAPAITSFSPAGENILVSQNIELNFDVEMNQESVLNSLKISPEIKLISSWNEFSSTVILTPENDWKKNTVYEVTLAKGSESVYGAKIINDLKFSFKTVEFDGVIRAYPAPGSKEVDPTTQITLTFSEVMNTDSVEANFSTSPQIQGNIEWDQNILVFTPSTKLNNSTRYTVSINGVYQNNKGETIDKSYSFNFDTKSNVFFLQAPVINQPAQFACNVTAAAIVLQYKGVNVSPFDVFNALPKQDNPKENGYWGNPHLGYVGSIYGQYPPAGESGGDGFGVYWDPIRNLINSYPGVSAEVKRGWNVTEILYEVEKGNPSILWWHNGVSNPEQLEWKSYDTNGNEVTITGINGMHSEVVIGYVGTPENPSQIIISDPWASRWGYGYRYVPITYFNNLWSIYNNTAVVVR